jgi:hypothetical protein
MIAERRALVAKKLLVDEEARSLKDAIHKARQAANVEGKWLSPSEYARMLRHLTSLQGESQKLQAELAELPKPATLTALRKACMEMLPAEVREGVFRRAREIDGRPS